LRTQTGGVTPSAAAGEQEENASRPAERVPHNFSSHRGDKSRVFSSEIAAGDASSFNIVTRSGVKT